MLKEVLRELSTVRSPPRGGRRLITVSISTGEEHGQYTIHLDVLEIDVGCFGSAELLVSAFDAHASAPSAYLSQM